VTAVWLCAPCSEGRCLLRGTSRLQTCDSCGLWPPVLCREVICQSHMDDGTGVCDDCGFPAEANSGEVEMEPPHTLFVRDDSGEYRAATEAEIGTAGYLDSATVAQAVEETNLYFAKSERLEKVFRDFVQDFSTYLSNRECDKEAYDLRQRYAQYVLSQRET
jgi:hypothetical protein